MAQLEGSVAAAAVTEASSDDAKTADTTPVKGSKGGTRYRGGNVYNDPMIPAAGEMPFHTPSMPW